MRRWLVRAMVAVAAVSALVMVGGAVLAEGGLRIPPNLRLPPDARHAAALASEVDATFQPVEIAASDGALLRGWLFRPREPGGRAAVLLHGVADSRTGVLAHARILLRGHYTVLTPDHRGHGASGGELISYGVRESDDVRRWVDWLSGAVHPAAVYGLGQSLGAAILIQSLPRTPAFRAIVAECPFYDFHEVAYDRLAQKAHVSRGLSTILFGPFIEFGAASPARALASARTPVLLIHGENDANIPPRHAMLLRQANPALVTLWMVPRADHVQAMSAAPAEYARRVTAWFDNHP